MSVIIIYDTTDSKNMFWTPQSRIVRQHNTYLLIKHWLQKKCPNILAKKQISTLSFKDRHLSISRENVPIFADFRLFCSSNRNPKQNSIRIHPLQIRHMFFSTSKKSNIHHYIQGDQTIIIGGDGFHSFAILFRGHYRTPTHNTTPFFREIPQNYPTFASSLIPPQNGSHLGMQT